MIGNWNYGTGRRKSSVARVFMKKGTGQIIINGKTVDEYFGRQTSIMVVKQPLMLTNNGEAFDIKINAPSDASCTGKISYTDGMKWTLGKRDEDNGQCRWTVTVPVSTGPGKATVDITSTKDSIDSKLSGTFNVEAIVASP